MIPVVGKRTSRPAGRPWRAAIAPAATGETGVWSGSCTGALLRGSAPGPAAILAADRRAHPDVTSVATRGSRVPAHRMHPLSPPLRGTLLRPRRALGEAPDGVDCRPARRSRPQAYAHRHAQGGPSAS